MVVLSSGFVRERHPMQELAALLERKRRVQGFCLLPVLYGITYGQCLNLAEGLNADVWTGSEERPSDEDLRERAAAVKELLDITAVREDQVGPV